MQDKKNAPPRVRDWLATPGSAATRAIENVILRYQSQATESMRKELVGMRKQFEELLRDAIRSETARTYETLSDFTIGELRNVRYAMQKLALRDSADFALKNMLKAHTFSHPHDTLRHGLNLAPKGGLALEFGVYSGSTLKIIAESRRGELVFGFDSFEGLPETWRDGFPAGAFAVNQLPDVPGAQLVVGWFNETLPSFLKTNSGPVDFLHVDCDLYSSTKTVFELVGERLRVGSVIVFDEFFNYPGWQQHEAKAWAEFMESHGVECVYEGYTFNNEQIVLRITAI